LALKRPSQAAFTKPPVTSQAADDLAKQLADKPYGGKADVSDEVKKAKPISISLPPELIEQLEDRVRFNKRSGSGPKTISAIIRESLAVSGFTI
jgi:hypothetical protein